MTFLEEYTIYCGICGGPIEDPNISHNWLSQATLLHRPEPRKYPDTSSIRGLPAKNNGGPYFEILETGEAITACDISGSVVPSPKPLYIPCHAACISIAKRAMAAFTVHANMTRGLSIDHVWWILESRFEKAAEGKMRPICNIYSAQAYGDIWRFQGLVWEPGSNDSELRYESIHFEANPEDIPDLAVSILSHLQLLPTGEKQPSSSSYESSPLLEAKDLPFACTFDRPPSAWRKALTEGDYLPWLWDLSSDAVTAKEASKLPGQEWNWELLVRQLAQASLHEPRAVIPDLTLGLRNRRRIWRLLEDIAAEQVD